MPKAYVQKLFLNESNKPIHLDWFVVDLMVLLARFLPHRPQAIPVVDGRSA